MATGKKNSSSTAPDKWRSPPASRSASSKPFRWHPADLASAASSLLRASGLETAGADSEAEAPARRYEALAPPSEKAPDPSGDARGHFAAFSVLPYLGALGLLGAAAWACRRFLRAAHGRGGLGEAAAVRWAVPRGPPPRGYDAVSSSERDGLLSAPSLAEGAASGGWSSGEEDAVRPQGAPMFKPLRVLGDAVKEKLASLSASTCASSCRSVPDDEALYGDPQRTEEEARGLLHSGYHSGEEDEDEEDEFFMPPKRACSRAAAFLSSVQGMRHRANDVDEDEEGEEAAINALMKLRPSMCDSLGDDQTDVDEGSARPLVGTERAGMLSR